MPSIRLLQDVAGTGPVQGSAGDVLAVDGRTASVWADGVRAALVRDAPPVEVAVVVPVAETTDTRARPGQRRG